MLENGLLDNSCNWVPNGIEMNSSRLFGGISVSQCGQVPCLERALQVGQAFNVSVPDKWEKIFF